jgi:hypothetical protein
MASDDNPQRAANPLIECHPEPVEGMEGECPLLDFEGGMRYNINDQ